MSTKYQCECGWVGWRPAMHRCHHYLEVQARAARVAAKKADPGIKRECTHPIANHKHGTRAAYVLDRCRCRPCRDARAAVEADRARAKAYGTWNPYTDVTPVRDHITELMARGLGAKRIAAAAGVAYSTVGAIIYGKEVPGRPRRTVTKLRHRTAERILKVTATLDDLGASIIVDPTGSRRRIEAMLTQGWSVNAFANAGGINAQCLRSVLLHVPLHARNARAIRDAYDRLWNIPVPEATHHEKAAATRARNTAARRGYLPPLAWDDDEIDDPYAGPAEVELERANALPVDDVEWLIAAGGTWETVATRLGMARDTLDKALRRNDRQDLIDRLTRAAA